MDSNLHEVEKSMASREFDRLSEFISTHCGIKMPEAKKIMLEARLQKRLRMLGVRTFREYCDYVLSPEGGEGELVHMIDAVTTNKTDFFREPVHFDFLSRNVLPDHIKAVSNIFKIWSAGCSSGEEPYTLAMVLSEFASQCSGFTFSILATDISTRVLDKAKAGIYDESLIADVPHSMKQKYLLRSKDRNKGMVRIVPDLRSRIRFERLNLMDESYPFREMRDVIFCRNVIIYFDRETQEKLINRFCRYLRPGGYIFLGHSETVHGLNVPLSRVASTIYRKEA